MNFSEILSAVVSVLSEVWSWQRQLFEECGSVFLITFIGLFVSYCFVRFFISRALNDFGSSDAASAQHYTDYRHNGKNPYKP